MQERTDGAAAQRDECDEEQRGEEDEGGGGPVEGDVQHPGDDGNEDAEEEKPADEQKNGQRGGEEGCAPLRAHGEEVCVEGSRRRRRGRGGEG